VSALAALVLAAPLAAAAPRAAGGAATPAAVPALSAAPLALPPAAPAARTWPAVPLAPLLVRAGLQPGAPLAARVEAAAVDVLAGPTATELGARAAGLIALAGSERHPTERAAAGILAVALTDPEAARSLKALWTGLPRTAELAWFAHEHPLRVPVEASPALRELAAWARADPAVARAFAAPPPEADLKLEGIRQSWAGELQHARGLSASYPGVWPLTYGHPDVPGAVVTVSSRRDFHALELYAGHVEDLGRDGLGPRLLGKGYTRGGLAAPHHLVVVEGVDGRPLPAQGPLDPADYELVADWADRARRAGWQPHPLGLRSLVLGATALDPERRAYMHDPGKSEISRPATTPAWRYLDQAFAEALRRLRWGP
jgi:hypothetical protein